MTTATIIDLKQQNQALTLKLAELETDQLSYKLFEKRVSSELDSLQSNRQDLKARVEELESELRKQKALYERQLRLRQQENEGLKMQIDILKQEKEQQAQMMEYMKKHFYKLEEELMRKTELINSYFKREA